MFYASLSGTSIDYSCGTMIGPFGDRESAQDVCDMKNTTLCDAGIPSAEAWWSVSPSHFMD